jgi:dihydroorotase
VPPDGFVADEVIEAKGLVAAPGLVDLAARLREPGFEYKATLESEMRAAVAGGVTTLACPPDTDPPLDEPGLVEMLKRRAASLESARVYPLGALTVGLKGERLAEMAELTDAGCVGFSQGGAAMPGTFTLYNAFQYAATLGYTVWLRPEDRDLARGGVAHDGEVATRLGLAAIPSIAETLALHAIIELMSVTGARVHLERISSGAGVALVARAKSQGARLTCDVGVHHLHLSDRDIAEFDANCRLSPPLREPGDRDRLRAGLADGTIDAVCSDHTPVDEDAKQVPFGEAEPGRDGPRTVAAAHAQMGQRVGTEAGRGAGRGDASRGAHSRRGGRNIGSRECCRYLPVRSWRGVDRALRRPREPGEEHPLPGPGAHRTRGAHARGRAHRLCKGDEMSNPLLDFSGLPRFGDVRPGHVGPAIDDLIAGARATVETLAAAEATPGWDTFVEPLDDANERLARAWGQVTHLNAVVNSPELRDAHNAALPKVTQFFTEQGQDQRLHAGFKALSAAAGFATLSPARRRHVDNALRDFRLGGAELPPPQKARFLEIQEEIARLGSRFQDNVLDATNDFGHLVTDRAELSGVPRTCSSPRPRSRRRRATRAGSSPCTSRATSR